MPNPDVVLWAGPVAPFQVPGATVPGAVTHFFTCTGNVAPLCSDVLVADASGRYLPNLLKRAGLSEDAVGRIFLGSFSAGGQTWKRLLMNPADRARITGAVLGDSAYETAPPSNPLPVNGYVEFALDVMQDPSKFFFASVSSNLNPSTSQPGTIWASGSQTLAATRAVIEQRSGQRFTTGGTLPTSYQPDALYRIGKNLIFADFGQTKGEADNPHGFHAKYAPEFWQNILVPWLQSGGGVGFDGNWLGSAAVVAVGVAIGYGGMILAEGWR